MNVQRGSRVVLRPRAHGDVLMRALEGRCGVVDAIEQDTEGRNFVAVVLENDPARDMGKARRLAHRFFLAPDEIEPLTDTAATPQMPRVLVAGIGNVFLGDDAFGVEVVKQLQLNPFQPCVNIAEFGIRGMDLVYALGDGYDAAILIDAAARGAPAGTIEVIEADDERFAGSTIEGHGMHPSQAIALARRLGPIPARLLVVACEPAVIPRGDEIWEGLSAPVASAVEPAAALVLTLIDELLHSQEPHPKEVTSA